MKGIKLFGISFGLSPIRPEGSAPIGLKYLKAIALSFLLALAASSKIYSIISFVLPYGLIGPSFDSSVTCPLTP